MNILEPLSYVATGVYATAVVLLAIYGLHSLWLLALFLRQRRSAAAQEACELATPLPQDLPEVLIQLPVFNERDVVERLVEAVGRLDWPSDRLHIQLLDDSTDDSVEIGRAVCNRLAARGLRCESLHRTDRTGFKAGALHLGLERSSAPFVAIFDADFVPGPDFLKRAIRPLLSDPGLALVQGRWEHLNRDESLLTSAQSLGIDGHFAIEQGARAWSGLAMNFNGTCGLWRREAIAAGGGWEHDTLTEDMDLSYRVQLAGWRCTYRLGLAVPGEVPTTVSAWRSQQFRWAKGSIQTAIKLMPRVWSSGWGLHRKLAATLHMTHYLVHPLILISLFAAPFALLLAGQAPLWALMAGFACFLVGASAPIITYIASQLVLYGRRGWRNLRHLPPLAALGTGIAVSNTSAVWQALRGRQSEFVRTPKAGSTAVTRATGSYRAQGASGMAELFCAAWAAMALTVGLNIAHTWITPLLALYLSGFGWMAVVMIRERQPRTRPSAGPSPMPWLLPLGTAAVGICILLAIEPRDWRRDGPAFAVAGALVGLVAFVSTLVVRRRPGGRGSLLWIAAVAVALRLACLALPTSHLADLRGSEAAVLAQGGDPYSRAPAELAVGSDFSGPVRDPALSTPPVLAMTRMVAEISPEPASFKGAALLLDLAALALLLALLARLGQPSSLLVAAAWNPLPAFLGAGAGLVDASLLLVVSGLYLASGNHHRRSLAILSLAAVTQPTAAPALLPGLLTRRWGWWLIPPAILALCLLPFTDSLGAAASSLVGFLGQPGIDGALESLIKPLLGLVLPRDLVDTTTSALLATTFVIGSILVLRRSRIFESEPPATITALLALGLACLPALTPVMMLPLILLLPFTRSLGLLLWSAMMPLAWLSQAPSGQSQDLLPSLLAHGPALALLSFEIVAGTGLVSWLRRHEEAAA